jgi:C1A family cysteine protease
MAENSYPYTAKDGTCAYNQGNSYTSINTVSWTNVTPQDIPALQAAVYQQTVSVSIQANKLCFQLYSSGVLNNTNCGTNLDHAVVTVGYGNESGQDYWLVRNSWGSGWGENGYIKIAAVPGDGICGIQMGPLYPTVN